MSEPKLSAKSALASSAASTSHQRHNPGNGEPVRETAWDEMQCPTMANINAVVSSLQHQRKETEIQIDRLDNAIQLLSGIGGGRGRGRGGARHISAAARQRITAAQKARRAKWRATHKKKK